MVTFLTARIMWLASTRPGGYLYLLRQLLLGFHLIGTRSPTDDNDILLCHSIFRKL